MFESLSSVAPPRLPPRPAEDVLDECNIRAVHDRLVEALEFTVDRDGRACAESIRALEELVCTITAAQAQLSVQLDRSQRVAQADAGVPAARQGRGVGSQVGFARRVSPHRGQRLLGLARVIADEMPFTWAAWRAGRINEWKAIVLARETACLSLADRLTIDAELAGDSDRIESMGPGELAAAAASLAAELDPEAVVAKRRKAESERHVSLRPAPDTMTWFTGLLPVKDGVAVLAALRHAADFHTGQGDPRSRGQIMADTLVQRVIGTSVAGTSTTTGPGVTLNLTMSATSLFGSAEEPGHIDGFGPIPAELAREIIADTLTRRDHIDVRRLFTHPSTGELLAMQARTRRFRGNLAKFIRLRDRTCRTPWCQAPIREIDHAEEHQRGGPTSSVNGQGLCQACNQAKTNPGWQARPGPGGSIETVMPTGIAYRTRPPSTATVRRVPIHIDFALTA